jgi:hypothetical protein
MEWVTQDQAIEIYARAFRRWFPNGAPQKAAQLAEELARLGDLDGERVWRAVAAEVVRLNEERGRHDIR